MRGGKLRQERASATHSHAAERGPDAVQQGTDIQSFLMLGVFAAIFVGPLLRSLLGRFLGATATGGVTGAAAWWLAGGMLFPAIAGGIIFFPPRES